MGKIGEWEEIKPGNRRKIFPPGQNVMIMEVQFDAGTEGDLHSHPHEQISYCVKGSLEYTVDGVVHLLKAGDAVVVPGGAKHGVKALEDSVLLDAFYPLREDLLK